MGLTYIGGETAQFALRLPGAAISTFQGMLLFFLLAFDLLTRYRIARTEGVATADGFRHQPRRPRAGLVVAATPLLFAALGELVVEKAGVLNLGVEGMMIIGAVTGFAVGVSTGDPGFGFLAAAARRRASRCSSGSSPSSSCRTRSRPALRSPSSASASPR
jgi:ABC-type uncharacterized transport system permease subunit